jgi:hypothetical protein
LFSTELFKQTPHASPTVFDFIYAVILEVVVEPAIVGASSHLGLVYYSFTKAAYEKLAVTSILYCCIIECIRSF